MVDKLKKRTILPLILLISEIEFTFVMNKIRSNGLNDAEYD